MINEIIDQLIKYGLSKNLLKEIDYTYAYNNLLELLKVKDDDFEAIEDISLENLLSIVIDYACNNNLIKENSELERESFKAKIMNCLIARPSEINKMFRAKYKKSPTYACQYLYNLSKDSYGINLNQSNNIIRLSLKSDYGQFLMMIQENRENFNNIFFNHREVSISVNNESNAWTLSYKKNPNVEEEFVISRKDQTQFYNNHKTFEEVIDFVNKFPQYYIGTDVFNLLSKDSKLQNHSLVGGKYDFPIENAEVVNKFKRSKVKIEILKWPVSVVRLVGNNENKLLDVMDDLNGAWKDYNDKDSHYSYIDVLVKLDGSRFNVYMIFHNQVNQVDTSSGIIKLNHRLRTNRNSFYSLLGLFLIDVNKPEDIDLYNHLLNEKNHSKPNKDDMIYKELLDDLKDESDRLEGENSFKAVLGDSLISILKNRNSFKSDDKNAFLSFIEKAV